LGPGQREEENQSDDGPAQQDPPTAWRGSSGSSAGCVHRVSAWGW
jgi:hypothetical protein